MNLRSFFPALSLAFTAVLLLSGLCHGHEIFQDILKEKYGLKSFSCKTCHQDADNRKLRTPFAELYHQEMKDGNWSEKFAQVEGKGDEALAAFEKEVGEAFKQTLDEVGKKSLTIDDLFASGLLAGVRVDEKKRKAQDARGKKPSAGNESEPDGNSAAAGKPTPSPSKPQPIPSKPTQLAGIMPKSDE